MGKVTLGLLGHFEYPDLTLNEAIELIRKIEEVGGKMSQAGLAKMVGIDARGAGLRSRINDLKNYGLIELDSEGELKVTLMGGEILEGYSGRAWDAFLSVPLYFEMNQRLRGKDLDKMDREPLQHMLWEITRGDSVAISRRVSRLKNNYMEALHYRPPPETVAEMIERGAVSVSSPEPRSQRPIVGNSFSVTDYPFYLVDRRESPFFISLDNPSKIDLAIKYLEDAKESLKQKPERKAKPATVEPPSEQ